MKRMIITPRQLKAINEATDGGDFTTIDDVVQKAGTQPTGDTSTIYTNTNPQPGKVGVAIRRDDLTGNTTDRSDLEGAPTVKVTNESRYTKRQVELGRMLEMRRTGKVFSKRQLNEMFMETQQNVDELKAKIGSCNIFDVFDAVENVFGEDVKEEMESCVKDGADLEMWLNDVFQNTDPDTQREFLDELG